MAAASAFFACGSGPTPPGPSDATSAAGTTNECSGDLLASCRERLRRAKDTDPGEAGRLAGLLCARADDAACAELALLYVQTWRSPQREAAGLSVAAPVFRRKCREKDTVYCIVLGAMMLAGDGVAHEPAEGKRLIDAACAGNADPLCVTLGSSLGLADGGG